VVADDDSLLCRRVVARLASRCAVGYIDDAERARPLGNQSVMRLRGVNDNKHLRIYSTTAILYVP